MDMTYDPYAPYTPPSVPAPVAAANIGWQRNLQQLTANPGGFTARNDGGGAYEPGISSGDFSSNANDTGSLLQTVLGLILNLQPMG